MRIKCLAFVLILCLSVPIAVFSDEMDDFIVEVMPYTSKIFSHDATEEDLSSIIVICSDHLKNDELDPYVKVLSYFWRSMAYIDMVRNGMGNPLYINNAMIDVARCLTEDIYMPECYMAAAYIYVQEKDKDKAGRTIVKVNELADYRFDDLMYSFSGNTQGKDELIADLNSRYEEI